MNDPSNGVPPALLPHVHLVSSFRFPHLTHMSVENIVDYLLQAPSVTRQTSPMNWTYLNAPADGTVLLVWQAPQLGPVFASDGYIWADPEQAFSLDGKGHTVEMYVHRSGYTPPEPVAAHGRRRYRLTASKDPSAPANAIDPSLWLIHYSAAEETARLPSNRIPIAPQTSQILSARHYLQSQGQLVRKEFMLHDRSNWPMINLPGGQPLPPQSSAPMASRGPPPASASYFAPSPAAGSTATGSAPPPSKRARHSATSATIIHGAAGVDAFLDDEEDTSRGDMIDHLTPREIAMQRYKQHHEWMEEILSSPYTLSQIVPVDLGLGLKGELEGLTGGVFDAPSGIDGGGQPPLRKGDLDKNERHAFEKRVEEVMNQQKKEIQQMSTLHAKRLDKLARESGKFRGWEARLQDLGRSKGAEDGEDGERADMSESAESYTGPKETVGDIVREVEAAMGKRIVEVREVVCRARGGLLNNPTLVGGKVQGFIYEKSMAQIEDEREEDEDGDAAEAEMDAEGDGDADGDIPMSNEATELLNQYGSGISAATPAATLHTRQDGVVNQQPSRIPHPATASQVSIAPAASAVMTTLTGSTPGDMEIDIEMATAPPITNAPSLALNSTASVLPTPTSTTAPLDLHASSSTAEDWVVVTPPAHQTTTITNAHITTTTSIPPTIPTPISTTIHIQASTTVPIAAPKPAVHTNAPPPNPNTASFPASEGSFTLDLIEDSAFNNAFPPVTETDLSPTGP